MRSPRATLILSFCLLAGSACAGGGPTAEAPSGRSAPTVEISIEDFAFAPERVTVPVGEAAVWTNADDILHTVTSGRGQKQGVPGVTEDKAARPDGLFDREVELDDTFTFVVEEAGTYRYFCAIHPGMTGVIVAR